jgi:hypothetical protein
LEGAGANVIGSIGTTKEALALIEGAQLDGALLAASLNARGNLSRP